MNWLFLEPNPIGLNTIYSMTGMSKPVFRGPYTPYDLEKRKQGVDLLQAFADYEIAGGRPTWKEKTAQMGRWRDV